MPLVSSRRLRWNYAHNFRDDEFRDSQLLEEDIPFIQDELDNVTTMLYLVIEGVRNDPESLTTARAKLC